MKYNFENNIILTSQNPGAFLTFYDPSPNSIYIDVSAGDGDGNLYVNGLDIAKHDVSNFILTLSEDTSIAPFHIYSTSTGDFEYNMQFNAFGAENAADLFQTIDVSIVNRPFLVGQEINAYETGKVLVENESSYLLLRTNPKYSGNIKLVIDGSNNLFLDTIKVSEILSNKKYRKQKVSGKSFLSGDISRVFKSLPQGEMFKIGNGDALNISKPKTNYSDQYDTIYNYGAQFLSDELYPEKNSIMAPLWINLKLPDYFVVFRLSGAYNEETYGISNSINDLAKKYITNSDIIKTWSLKETSPLGIYLNNHLSELSNTESPVTLSLNEYDANTWNGIVIDKGIIAGRSEVPYFFQKDASSFTKINAFVSGGFERQNLLCPNLINLEFVFDDYDVSSYVMNRYFGLYLTENELYKISYYKDDVDSSVNIISLDGKDVSIFIDSSVFQLNGDVSSGYANRIFVINDGNKLERISNKYQFNLNPSTVEDYANKLGDNILSTEVIKKKLNTFITLKINNLLLQGEHLRIVDKNNFKIWETYGTDEDTLNAGEATQYVTSTDPSPGYPRLYRSCFSTKGEIKDQINGIAKAFYLFNSFGDLRFNIGFIKENGLSLIVEDSSNKYSFQRLTSQTSNVMGDHDSLFNSFGEYSDIGFYNTFIPDSSDFSRVYYDASFGPINFEIFGDRMVLDINMYNSIDASYFTYSFDSSISEVFTDYVMYEATDGLNRRINTFDISTNINRNSFYVEDPTSDKNKALIITEKEIDLDLDDYWWGYDLYNISISLMGINSVKDFDFAVYDNSTNNMNFNSVYRNCRIDDVSMYEMSIDTSTIISKRNSYKIIGGEGNITIDSSKFNYPSQVSNFNTFFGSAIIDPSTTSRITYNSIDGSYNFTSYNPDISEENIDDYYVDNYIDVSKNVKSKKALKYSLVLPTITKWGGLGKDVRNNDIRLLLTTKFFTDSSTINSNFIPKHDTSLYSNELSYPIFKYLSAGESFGGDYVYYDVNDVAVDASGNRTRIRDLMFNNPKMDIFSKILYNTNNISGRDSKSSIVYYNLYKDNIKTILKGLNLEIEVTGIGERQLSAQKWDRYRISFISSPSRLTTNTYRKPIEVIINENTKTILIIWYQGSDVLNYSKSRSSVIEGQNILIDSSAADSSIGNKSFTNFTIDSSATYIKSPFIVNTGISNRNIVNIYDSSSNYSGERSSRFAQFNYNANGLTSIFNAYGMNRVDSSIFTFYDKSFDTFDQTKIDYTFFRDLISYSRRVNNISYIYNRNVNDYSTKANDINLFKYFIDINKVRYFVFRDDTILSFDDFSSPPIKITIMDPIEYKAPNYDTSIYTYNGGYKPIFKDILNFNDNEPDLINIVQKDFVAGNTDLISYNNIYQYWYNRVVSTVTDADSSDNIIYTTDHNPFSARWDASYYTLSTGSINTEIHGYKSGVEKPAFFGSKIIKLPDDIVLDTWDAQDSKVTETYSYFTLDYNLTKGLSKKFLNNFVFLNNWGDLEVGDDDLNEYINKTILNYYDISKEKLNVEVWAKTLNNRPTSSTVLSTSWDTSFDKEIKNLSGQLKYDKGVYIYSIVIVTGTRNTYYSKITIKNKK